MSLDSTATLTFADRCYRVSRVIHWLTVALMIGLVVTAMFWGIDPHGTGNAAFLWHSSLGIGVYLLSMSRLLLWLVYRPTRRPADAQQMRGGGRTLRYAFYALLLALPLSGWLLASEEGTPTYVFGMPALSQWHERGPADSPPVGSASGSHDAAAKDTPRVVYLDRIHAALAAALSAVIVMHVFSVYRNRVRR